VQNAAQCGAIRKEVNMSKETHESYGMIGVHRTQGTVKSLFGSSISHQSTITITIKRAEIERHLNRNWYFGRDLLCKVEMSPTQFAEMITSLNVGDGVPCTLRYIENHERIADPPSVSQRQIFEDEFKEDVCKIHDTIQEDADKIRELLTKKGGITVAERKEVLNTISTLMRTLTDSIPFLQKSFNEAMDKTVTEAKGEVEAFVMNKITSLGLEKMKETILEIPETT
jgi:hypothetical protein